MVPREATIAPERIRAELSRLLASDDFLRAPRSAKLLDYLVRETLEGRGERIKGPSIAMDVFDRDASFDSTSDPIVRVQAGRLRALLASHYAAHGRVADLVVEIPKGRYVPRFRPRDECGPADSGAAVPEPAPSAPERDGGGGEEPVERAARGADATTGTETSDEARRTGHPRWRMRLGLVGVGLVLAFLTVLVLRPTLFDGVSETLSARADAYPTILVPPFENLTGDARHETLETSFQHQLAADLERFPTVRPRISDALELPVRDDTLGNYAILGLVLQGDDGIEVILSLADLVDGGFLASERVAMDVENEAYFEAITAVSATISGRIASAGGYIARRESTRPARRRVSSFGPPGHQAHDFYRCLIDFNAFTAQRTSEAFTSVYACLQSASALAPDDGTLMASFAWLNLLGSAEAGMPFRLGTQIDTDPKAALVLANHAVEVDPGNSVGHQYLGLIRWFMGDVAGGIDSLRRARSLNVADPDAAADLALFLALSGQWYEAMDLAATALSKNPNPPGWYRLPAFYRALAERDAAKARFLVQRGALVGDGARDVLYAVVASLNGEADRAESRLPRIEAYAAAHQSDPLYSLRRWVRDPQIIAVITDALRDLGIDVPEQVASRSDS